MSSLPLPSSQETSSEAGKRLWETGESGYMNWALGRLVRKGGGEGTGHGDVDKLDAMASGVGSGEDLKRAFSVVQGVGQDLAGVEGARRRKEQLEDIIEEDSRMEE